MKNFMMTRNSRSANGFTLIEMLVSIAVMLFLITGAVSISKVLMENWRSSEQHRATYDNAQFLFNSYINADFSSIHIDLNESFKTGYPSQQSWFLADYDDNNKKRFRFLISNEQEHRLLGGLNRSTIYSPALEGDYLPGTVFILRGEIPENNETYDIGIKPVSSNKLKEVIYCMGSDENSTTLYRCEQVAHYSQRTIIRSNNSGRSADPVVPGYYLYESFRFEDVDEQDEIDRLCSPVCEDILYFDCEFWGLNTTQWEADDGTVLSPDDNGPEIMWDSTRALYSTEQQTSDYDVSPYPLDYSEGNEINVFTYTLTGGNVFLNATDSNSTVPAWRTLKDDIYPSKIRITLVLRSNSPFAAKSQLIADQTGSLTVDNARYFANSGYVRIDNEWIKYSGKTSTQLTGCIRGQRNTTAGGHAAGATVESGISFQLIVPFPIKKK